jgi:hypothetical protein
MICDVLLHNFSGVPQSTILASRSGQLRAFGDMWSTLCHHNDSLTSEQPKSKGSSQHAMLGLLSLLAIVFCLSQIKSATSQ